MKVLVIIPAKLDSKRLKEKNLREINGKTLVEHSIDYAKSSIRDVEIFISSEDDRLKDIATKNDVKFIKRSVHLCGETEVTTVYKRVVTEITWRNLTKLEYIDLVVALQPDNPNRSNTLDECINYMLKNNYEDLITVNSDYKRSGSVRIFKYGKLVAHEISSRIGCIRDNATDIHTEEDLYYCRKLLNG